MDNITVKFVDSVEDLPKSDIIGTICSLPSGELYVFTGESWKEIYVTSVPDNPKELKSHHCTSCGAPLRSGDNECQYCGTEYW